MILWSTFFARILSILLRCHSNCHWRTRVVFLVSGCRNCHHLVNNDVLQCNRRPSEPVIQAFWHQRLDVLKLVRLVCERPQDVVKLLHILCPVPLGGVADQCCTR